MPSTAVPPPRSPASWEQASMLCTWLARASFGDSARTWNNSSIELGPNVPLTCGILFFLTAFRRPSVLVVSGPSPRPTALGGRPMITDTACPDPQTLERLLLGRLTGDDADRWEEH